MMLVCFDDSVELSQEEEAVFKRDVRSWITELGGRGVRLEGGPLPVSDATTVRVRNGEVLLTDGPFAEAKEHMAGYDILECKDLDEAIEVASKHPLARQGAMELRPFPAN
jgi:hypothetical protein